MRVFRLQVYAAFVITAVTMPISYIVFDAAHGLEGTATISSSVVNTVKSTAFYIENSFSDDDEGD